MADEASKPKVTSALASYIALAKDVFALLRDSVLFMAALLLLAFPVRFNAILSDAGFEEGSFAGLKWKRQFVDTDTALRTAQDTITSLQTQNAELLQAVKAAQNGAGEADRRTELARLESSSVATAAAARQVQASVGATLATNDRIVEKARAAIAADTPPSPAYCYQEDRIAPGPQRYSVHCHASMERCEVARGPNPRTRQSACMETSLSGAAWQPQHPGWMGSWYQMQSMPFGSPFPGLP